MISSTERDYLKETIEKDIKKTQKLIAKLQKEVDNAEAILEQKRNLKDQLVITLNNLNDMKQHVASVIL